MKKKLLLMTLISALALATGACGSEEPESVLDSLESVLDVPESVLDVPESENESSVAETEVAELGTFTFDIPEGFVELSDGYYEHENGLDLSTINYLTQPNDGSFYQVGGQILVEATEAQLETMYGVDITIILSDEEFYKIDGVDAFKYSIEYDLMDFHFKQTQVIVDDPETFHFVTCTLIDDEDYAEVFNTFIDSLRFE